MFNSDKEMKGWTYGAGDKVYIWDYEADDFYLSRYGEPCIGNITVISNNMVEVELITSEGTILTDIDNVWHVGTGPCMAKPVKEDPLEGFEEAIMDARLQDAIYEVKKHLEWASPERRKQILNNFSEYAYNKEV